MKNKIAILTMGAIFAFVVFSCSKPAESSNPTPAVEASPVAVSELQSSEAYVLLNGLPTYVEADGKLKWVETLTVGDKVSVKGSPRKINQDGVEKEFVQIRTPSGKDALARTAYLASNSTLAVVAEENASIYTEPRDVKVTSKTLPRLTIVAVSYEGMTDDFLKVTAYDSVQQTIAKDVFLQKASLATSDEDVNAAIVLTVALATKNEDVKKKLLSTAVTKFANSTFAGTLQAELDKLPSAQ